MMRIAGAPISWGVCEVPGWGYQLTAGRVLAEMAQLSIMATEFGPDGFLAVDPVQRRDLLASYGLQAVGGFVPVVLHEPGHDPVPEVLALLPAFTGSGAGTLVLAAATGRDGYEGRPELETEGWKTLLANLDRLDNVAAEAGITATLHPHVGTMVEQDAEVWRVLDGSGIGLCLDTGHLLVGGADPVRIAQEAGQRVAHAHLKDVDAAMAQQVRRGDLSYHAAVANGMYRPLGDGEAGIADVVRALASHGYDGWYVMEQDAVLAGEPAQGDGPLHDVQRSLSYLMSIS